MTIGNIFELGSLICKMGIIIVPTNEEVKRI